MDTGRNFIKKAMLLSGAAGMASLPASIQKAFAINPEPGTTYLDAEHVVLLRQENCSFDHAYGTLRGVRGFNDPRAMRLPNNNLVWLQTNAKGETYAPFRLDIKDTKVTAGNVVLLLKNNGNTTTDVEIKDNAYNATTISKPLVKKASQTVVIDLSKNFGWYDLSVAINGNTTSEKRYAGHVETGKPGKSDPLMGNM